MKTLQKLIVASIAFVVIVLIEIPFYLKVPEQQPEVSNASSLWRSVINLLLKGGGNTPNLAVIVIYLSCYKQKHRAAIHVLLYSWQLFITFTLRSIYKKPRPYMQFYVYCQENPQPTSVSQGCQQPEQPYSCKGSFGLPSLHALSCTSITMYVLFDFIITRKETSQVLRYQTDASGSLIQLPPLYTKRITNLSASLILFGGLVYTFMTGYLQWRLEISYLNQLVYGWFLGLWLACVFAFIIRVPFYNYIQSILEDRQEIGSLRRHTLAVATTTLTMMSICVVEFFIVKGKNGADILEYETYLQPLEPYCTGLSSVYKSETWFYGGNVAYSSAYIIILTGYLGIIYQRTHFKGQLFIELHAFDSKFKRFLRLIGRLAVMSVSGILTFWLVSFIYPIVQKSPIGIWQIYFIGVLVPYSVGSFLVFALGDWFCLNLHLYQNNEVFGLSYATSVMSVQEGNLNLTSRITQTNEKSFEKEGLMNKGNRRTNTSLDRSSVSSSYARDPLEAFQ